jgi:hypothetical protein
LIPTRVAIAALAALSVGAPIAAFQGAPWPFWAGSALAAGAPLIFTLRQLRSGEPLAEHPIVVSILSGSGCVSVMVASKRFGAENEWTLYPALAALVVWMLWQRGQRRARPPQPR